MNHTATIYRPAEGSLDDLLQVALVQHRDHPAQYQSLEPPCREALHAFCRAHQPAELLIAAITVRPFAAVLVAVDNQLRTLVHPLTIQPSIDAEQQARQAVARARQTLEKAEEERALPSPGDSVTLAVSGPNQWSINALAGAAAKGVMRRTGLHSPAVPDEQRLHRPARSLAITASPQSVNIAFVEQDGDVVALRHGEPAPPAAAFTARCAKAASVI